MATAGAYKGVAFTFNYSFVTASDPTTLFTGTLLTSEVKVITRDGATTNAAANITTAPTHEFNGVFEVNLSASEMNHDEIVIVLVPSAADVVVESISITTEPSPADVIEVDSNANAATRLALSASQIIPGTVDTVTNTHTPTVTEFQADDITEATGDHYNGRIVIFTSGSLIAQATEIIDYALVGGIGQFTVVSMTDAPANNDTFIIV